MLLTISTTHQPATDLGYLLHKNPARLQTEELSFGKAYVFYPDASSDICTAALLIEIDPVALVRGRGPAGEGGQLEQYVNDRPYAANSFLSVALGRIFSTAMSGRSKDRQELAETAIPLIAHLPVIAARGGEDLVKRLFEPLGYSVEMQGSQLDDKFPEWGASPYVTLTVAGTVRLQDLLTHLYVLIPVLDNEKHYWVANDEIEKLLKRGEGWLGAHPEKDLIVSRYLKRQRSLTREALSRLLAEDAPSDESRSDAFRRAAGGWNAHFRCMTNACKPCCRSYEIQVQSASSISVVAKASCSSCSYPKSSLRRSSAWMCHVVHLETAKERLRLDELPERQRSRIELIQGSLTYRDQRLNGFEAAAIVEVIEHFDAPRLATLSASSSNLLDRRTSF